MKVKYLLAVPDALYISATSEKYRERQIRMPWDYSKRLAAATHEQRKLWQIVLDGHAIAWPSLGEVLLVSAIDADLR